MNKLILKGTLTRLHKFSDKVGVATIRVLSDKDGQETANSFSVTVFKGLLDRLSLVPIDSIVTIEGKIKNNSYEKDGQKTWKLETVMDSFTVSDEIGKPTRIAAMSPQESKYETRANSDFSEENIPF